MEQGHAVWTEAPLKLQEIWAIRIRLQLAGNSHDLALVNLAIDSKLRACDLVKLKVTDVAQGAVYSHVPVFYSKKQNNLFSLKLRLRLYNRWTTGYCYPNSLVVILCSQAG